MLREVHMQADTHAFIVRIWYEPLDDEGTRSTWRGSVEYVGSDRRIYFQVLDELVRFIQERTGINAGRPASEIVAGLNST